MKAPHFSTTQVRVSVVIPCFNEEARIAESLEKLIKFRNSHYVLERIRVVNDGSTDDTVTIVQSYMDMDRRIELMSLRSNQGEGAAVRAGVVGIQSDWILVTDADLSTPIDELPRLLDSEGKRSQVILGSRGMPGSRIDKRQPRFREWMGRGWRALVRLAVLEDIYDAQCGFKVFSRPAAERIFSRQLINSYAFHVETIVLAQLEGFSVREVPVRWSHAKHSRVSVLSDPFKMAADLLRIRWRFRNEMRVS